jgi:hypothetical protein
MKRFFFIVTIVVTISLLFSGCGETQHVENEEKNYNITVDNFLSDLVYIEGEHIESLNGEPVDYNTYTFSVKVNELDQNNYPYTIDDYCFFFNTTNDPNTAFIVSKISYKSIDVYKDNDGNITHNFSTNLSPEDFIGSSVEGNHTVYLWAVVGFQPSGAGYFYSKFNTQEPLTVTIPVSFSEEEGEEEVPDAPSSPTEDAPSSEPPTQPHSPHPEGEPDEGKQEGDQEGEPEGQQGAGSDEGDHGPSTK